MSEFSAGMLLGAIGAVLIATIQIYKADKEIKELKQKLKVKDWLEEREIAK